MIKTIIKRIIIGVAIALILGFIGNIKPKALVSSASMPTNWVSISPQYYDFVVAGFNTDTFLNTGDGYVIFNINIIQDTNRVELTNVYLERWDTGHINCSINEYTNYDGIPYTDSVGYTGFRSTIASVTCPWEDAGSALKAIHIHINNDLTYNVGSAWYQMSNYISFYSSGEYNALLAQIYDALKGTGGIDEELEAVNTELDGIRNDMNVNQRQTWVYLNTIITTLGTNQTSLLNTLNTNSQTQVNKQEEINQSVKEVNNTIKDDSVDEPQDYSSNVATNGVITNLITLPIQLFTKILNSTSASCSPFVLGDLLGETLTMPCINLSNYLGTTLYNVIDILISGLFIYHISRKMVKVFNSLSSMKEGDVING